VAQLIKVDGTTSEVLPKNGKTFTAEEYQSYVGGYFEQLRLPDGSYLIMDEDGKIKRKRCNPMATLMLAGLGTAPSDLVVGDVLVVTAKENG